MGNEWLVAPEALQRARLAQLFTQEDLARKSGVSARSIRSFEKQEQRVRVETLQCLAKALAVEVKAIARLRAKNDGGARASAQATKPIVASVIPARTQLEAVVEKELALGEPPSPLVTATGPVPQLTAKHLQDVFTAYALHAGARFFLCGVVDTQRGVDAAEAKLLGGKPGVAARFHVIKDIGGGESIGITVHAAYEAHTKALQGLHKKIAALVVRVVLAPEGPDGERRDDVGFTSFITKVATRRPWTFVVEEIASEGDSAGARTGAGAGARVGAKKKARA